MYDVLHLLQFGKLDTPKREDLERVAIEWNSKLLAFGACKGCVGAIDGWLCCINKPRVHNAAHHCSGHCQRHGINVQAVVDANLRFLHFGTISPGRMNDARDLPKLHEAWRVVE